MRTAPKWYAHKLLGQILTPQGWYIMRFERTLGRADDFRMLALTFITQG